VDEDDTEDAGGDDEEHDDRGKHRGHGKRGRG
jgi:hypothetical protein